MSSFNWYYTEPLFKILSKDFLTKLSEEPHEGVVN